MVAWRPKQNETHDDEVEHGSTINNKINPKISRDGNTKEKPKSQERATQTPPTLVEGKQTTIGRSLREEIYHW